MYRELDLYQQRLQSYIEATYHLSHPQLVALRSELLSAPGAIAQPLSILERVRGEHRPPRSMKRISEGNRAKENKGPAVLRARRVFCASRARRPRRAPCGRHTCRARQLRQLRQRASARTLRRPRCPPETRRPLSRRRTRPSSTARRLARPLEPAFPRFTPATTLARPFLPLQTRPRASR